MNQGKIISGYLVDVIKRKVQNELDSACKVLGKFAEEVKTNPARAFEWSKEKFEAAAIVDVYGDLLTCLQTDDVVWEGFHLRMMKRVVDKAKFIENSSSQQSVYMERAKLAAMAKFCEILEWNQKEVVDETCDSGER